MPLIRLFIILSIFLSLCKSIYAGPAQTLNAGAEAEFDFSSFQRNPQPQDAKTGSNLSQDFKVYLEGGVLNQGKLDSVVGVAVKDKYRKNATDIDSDVRFDYSKWLMMEVLTDNKTDEDIFFSGSTAQPQSPIHSLMKKYSSRVALDSASSLEYVSGSTARKDLFLGTVTNEETDSQKIVFNSQHGPLALSSQYHKGGFKDLLGVRNNIDRQDLSLEASYRPQDALSIIASYQDEKNDDVSSNTSLHSQDSRFEIGLKPLRELRIRNRTSLKENNDTKSLEDITDTSNETIINFTPSRQMDFEVAYKRSDEDKQRSSVQINSTINEERIKVRVSPVPKIDIQSGYNISDKSSTSATENIENTKAYADVSLEPLEHIRLGAGVSDTRQRNTFTSLTESDTKSVSTMFQYRPKESASFFLQLDTSRTDNPSTASFTKTDTISSNTSIKPYSYLELSLRNSAQNISGSQASASSKRLLNAIEINMRIIESLKLSTQYQVVNSSGQSVSDENLFDIAVLYSLGRFDCSLRFQDRHVSGENRIDKKAISSDVKYRLSPNAIFSFRFSLVDYNDGVLSANSYDSTLVESLLSLKF